MLSFFKRLRYQLVHNNRLQKYFVYAIGEIILVVTGILIALQVNNWNVQRINRNIEAQMIVLLKKEYQNNYKELEKRKGIRKDILNSTMWLLEAKDKGELLKHPDSVDFHLANTFVVPTFDPIRGVTDEIINSGKLQLIQNEDLRIALTSWLSSTLDLIAEEEQYANFAYNQYGVYLIKNYAVRPLVNILQTDPNIEKFLDFERPDFYIGDSETIDKIKKLATCNEFENYLSLIMGWNNLIHSGTENLLSINENLLKLIDESATDL
jgi:hypothetical protein